MIEISDLTFKSVLDPIKTEETLYYQLRDLDLDYPYVAFPVAFSINSFGVERTQFFIDTINSRYPQKKIFVCQHIYVNRIKFGENFVFTPHTEEGDSYYFIPHYNPIYLKKPGKKNIAERKYEFSFMGDFKTHPDRFKLSQINSIEIPIHPTGMWFFSHSPEDQKNLLSRYTEFLASTKISICPRGSGPSTLRLFESMSVGSVPLIFNDLKIPEFLKELVLKSRIENFIAGDRSFLEGKDLQKISDVIYETYWDEFSNENLYKSIIKSIK